jgi:hypothetical protein
MPDQCATCGAGDALLFRCGDCDRQFCTEHTQPDHECVTGDAGPTQSGEGTASTEEGVGFEWGAGAPGTERTKAGTDSRAATTADPFAGSGFQPVEDDGRGADEGGAGADGGTTARGATSPEPRTVDGTATDAVRRAEPQPRRVEHGVGIHQAVRPDSGRVPERREADRPEPLLADDSSPSVARSDGGGVTASASDGTDRSFPIRPMDTRGSPGTAERSDPETLSEWLRQQTYVSLTIKTGAIAAVVNAALYFGMLLAMSGLLGRFLG